jgi:glycosyltransferase involved in cell wall biosynthesis
MKILHIIPSISSKRGGPSTAIMSMVKALRNEGIDASILTTSDNSLYREAGHPLKHWFTINEIPVLMFPVINSQIKLFREYLISPRLIFWLFKNIDSFDAVHIHAIFSCSTTISMIIARLKGIPYIVRTIGQLNSWSLTQSRLKKSLMLSLTERKNLMNALAIHVTSKAEMDDVKKICNHKNILCLGLGVDVVNPLIASTPATNQTISFVFLSRIHPKKQLDKLLEAFSIISKGHNKIPWKLYVAGSGDTAYVTSLKQLADIYGIGGFIEWMGHLDGEKKLRLLQASDWYVLPSISENFGLSVVEALATGLPVIVSEGVGISDTISQNKAGLVTDNSFSLTDALRLALKGPPLKMRESALNLARDKFSWTKIGKELADFYYDQIKTHKKR